MTSSRWMVFLVYVTHHFLTLSLSSSLSPRQYDLWFQRARHRHLHGPNVCAVERFPGLDLTFHTESQTMTQARSICGHQGQLTYECCVGFEQIEGHPGCLAAGRLDTVMGTLRQLGAEWMAKSVLGKHFRKNIGKNVAVTVFASKRAITEKHMSNLTSRGSVVDYHIVKGRYRLVDMSHNAILRPVHGIGQLKITRYKNGVTAVNCARILSPGHQATDGILHVIDRLLEPPGVATAVLDGSTVADRMVADPQLTQFVGLLKKSGLLEKLHGRQAVTVFAPIDKAFNRLSSSVFSHVTRGKHILNDVLRYHIVPELWCAAGITAVHQARTLEGSTLNMTCSGAAGLRVDGAKVTRVDMVARNGVIHYIDDILSPSRSRTLSSLLSSMGLSKFAHFFTISGLNSTFAEGKPLTIFAPSNKAFNALPPEVARRFHDDPSYTRQVLLHHVTAGRHKTGIMKTGRDLKTLNGRPARVHIYPWATAVEAACLTHTDIKAIDGILHITDSIILPPEGTVADVIARHADFTILRASLQASGLVTVFQRPGAFTLLAPTDRAFQSLPSRLRDVMLRDPTHVARILRFHVLGDIYVSCSIKANLVYPLVTLLGNEVRVRRQGNQLMVETAILIEKDLMATNGVVHVIDTVLSPDKSIY